MINVSNEFWREMQNRTDFKENAEITFSDGTILELDESVFTLSNNSLTDAAGANSIPLGIALSRSIQMELMNNDGLFSAYDFFGAKIRLYLKFQLSESVEKIEYGTFTVISPSTYGETVIITANDDMYKANKEYSTNIAFPAQAWVVLQDACMNCGILLGTTEFLNKDFVIQEKPSGNYTYRQIIAYIAMIAGGNARINRQGYLEILSYDFSFLNEVADGGSFNPWTGGYDVDGGTFNPWTDGDTLDGGLFTDKKDYHILYHFRDSPNVDTDDVVITGLQTTIEAKDGETESTTILLGKEGYVLKIENPLISGKEQEALRLIGATMIGGRMRKFEGDHISYPIAEFMDKAFVVDRHGNTYGTILTDVNFTFFGYTTLKNSAENAVRNASQFDSSSTQALIKARELVNREKTQRELAVSNLANALATSSGLYITTEEQEDKSFIYYMHNKKTLSESDIVWKLTAQAFGISTDGGKSYPYGLDASGVAILKEIYAIGIDASYILTGMIKDKSGKSFWDLINGKLHINGTFSQETVGGLKSVEIKDNAVNLYAWNKDGDYVGSLGSLKGNGDEENRVGLGLWVDENDLCWIGYKDEDGGIKPVFKFDPTDIKNGSVPFIINTVSGTIFPNNPSGGVSVKHGLITNWNMSGSNKTIFPNQENGGVKLSNGLVTGVGLDGVGGTLFPTHSSGGITVKDGLITNWGLDTVSGTLDLISGISWNGNQITSITRTKITVKSGLICGWSSYTNNY